MLGSLLFRASAHSMVDYVVVRSLIPRNGISKLARRHHLEVERGNIRLLQVLEVPLFLHPKLLQLGCNRAEAQATHPALTAPMARAPAV